LIFLPLSKNKIDGHLVYYWFMACLLSLKRQGKSYKIKQNYLKEFAIFLRLKKDENLLVDEKLKLIFHLIIFAFTFESRNGKKSLEGKVEIL